MCPAAESAGPISSMLPPRRHGLGCGHGHRRLPPSRLKPPARKCWADPVESTRAPNPAVAGYLEEAGPDILASPGSPMDGRVQHYFDGHIEAAEQMLATWWRGRWGLSASRA